MTAMWFLLAALACILIQGVFAMFEMATVSFHRVRLEALVASGNAQARWLSQLIQNPSRLFGTTLLGLNTALQLGSECARRFYEALSLDPDWAPLSQVILVILFGELIPMMAARRSPHRLALALTPAMAIVSRLLSPLLWILQGIARLILGKQQTPGYLSRDEVQRAFEERSEGEELERLMGQIFRFKTLRARDLMEPVAALPRLPFQATVGEMRAQLRTHASFAVLLTNRGPDHIVGVAHLRDYLRSQETEEVFTRARTPWLVPVETPLIEVLELFRKNNQTLAILVGPEGNAVGLLPLDEIIDQLFGTEGLAVPATPQLHLERTLPGDLKVTEFNRQFGAHLPSGPGETLSDFMAERLGHRPGIGETLTLDPYEFKVVKASLRGVKSLRVRTLSE